MPANRLQLKLGHVLLQPGSLETQIGAALDLALEFMRRSPPDALLDTYLGNAGSQVLSTIKRSVMCVDHAGLITPARTDARELNAIADRHGFTENHKTFPSVIVASELAALNGDSPVPTQIFRGSTRKADATQPSFGIEMFVPDTFPDTVERWIKQGVGTHAAFRVHNRADVDLIRTELIAAGFHTPSFMGGKSMANTNDGTLTVYFDLTLPDGDFRLEFFHRAAD